MTQSSSTFNLPEVTDPVFERTVKQFETYDDQQISFVDHRNTALNDEFVIERIFAFEEELRTLGLTRVPVDTDDTAEWSTRRS